MELDSQDTLKPPSLPHFFNHPGILFCPPGAALPIRAACLCCSGSGGAGVAPGHHPPLRQSRSIICSSDASTSCRLSQPMKLIPFICVFASVDTGCYPPPSSPPLPRRTVSVASVSCARYSFHASFVASQPRLINKTPLLFFPLRHLCAGAGVACQTSRHRRVGEGLAEAWRNGDYQHFGQ